MTCAEHRFPRTRSGSPHSPRTTNNRTRGTQYSIVNSEVYVRTHSDRGLVIVELLRECHTIIGGLGDRATRGEHRSIPKNEGVLGMPQLCVTNTSSAAGILDSSRSGHRAEIRGVSTPDSLWPFLDPNRCHTIIGGYCLVRELVEARDCCPETAQFTADKKDIGIGPGEVATKDNQYQVLWSEPVLHRSELSCPTIDGSFLRPEGSQKDHTRHNSRPKLVRALPPLLCNT